MSAVLSVDMIFGEPILSQVVTLQEACVLWDKTPRQLHWAIDRDQVDARKSVTGGTWLVTYESLLAHFGAPAKEINNWMV